MPLKEVGFELSIPSCPVASATGVVNTLVHTESGWEGYNTDSFGIQKAISSHTESVFQTIQILGSGATARSAIHAARELYPDAQLEVFARKNCIVSGIQTRELEQFGALPVGGLTISTLPGTATLNALQTLEDAVILDVAYDPWPSKLASKWAPDNRISGLEMLLWQALIQIRLFVNGDGTALVENEAEVFSAMSSAVKAF